jgi:hypothetical protein
LKDGLAVAAARTPKPIAQLRRLQARGCSSQRQSSWRAGLAKASASHRWEVSLGRACLVGSQPCIRLLLDAASPSSKDFLPMARSGLRWRPTDTLAPECQNCFYPRVKGFRIRCAISARCRGAIWPRTGLGTRSTPLAVDWFSCCWAYVYDIDWRCREPKARTHWRYSGL